MEQNPAKLKGVMAASHPPAIITSASPRCGESKGFEADDEKVR